MNLVKKSILFLVMVLSIFGIIVGCAQTPETEIVTNKSDTIVANSYSVDTESDNLTEVDSYDAPSQWTDSFTSNNGLLTVNISANVDLPEPSVFPIYAIAPKDITVADVQNYIDAFFNGQTVYNAKPSGMITKKDITNVINQEQEYLEKLKETDPDRYNAEIDGWNMEIENQFAMLQSDEFPPDYEYEVVDQIAFTPPNGMIEELANNYGEIRVSTDLGEDQRAEISAFKNSNNKMNSLVFNDGNTEQHSEITVREEDNPIGLTISREDALKTAEGKLNELGIDGMTSAHIILRPCTPSPLSVVFPDEEERNMFYEIYFTRDIDGVSYNYIDNGDLDFIRLRESGNEYAEPWADEYVSVVVNDNGVCSVAYHQLSEITGQLEESSLLLPFDKIMSKFNTQIEVSNSWMSDPTITEVTFNIEKIKLGYAKVLQMNNPSEYMLVPAWDFYGNYVVKYSNEVNDPNFNENNEFISPNYYAMSFLTLNAIDGSVINRDLGY